VFGFVKRNLSGAQRRMDTASGERGAGKGAAALVPASAHRVPERGQRSIHDKRHDDVALMRSRRLFEKTGGFGKL